MTMKKEEVTIEQLTNALENIEDWIRIVKTALATMDKGQPVKGREATTERQPASDYIRVGLAGKRERGGSCIEWTVIPASWKAHVKEERK